MTAAQADLGELAGSLSTFAHLRFTFCPPSQLSAQEFAPSLSPSIDSQQYIFDWPDAKRRR
jgi:hypothetical protein